MKSMGVKFIYALASILFTYQLRVDPLFKSKRPGLFNRGSSSFSTLQISPFLNIVVAEISNIIPLIISGILSFFLTNIQSHKYVYAGGLKVESSCFLNDDQMKLKTSKTLCSDDISNDNDDIS